MTWDACTLIENEVQLSLESPPTWDSAGLCSTLNLNIALICKPANEFEITILLGVSRCSIKQLKWNLSKLIAPSFFIIQHNENCIHWEKRLRFITHSMPSTLKSFYKATDFWLMTCASPKLVAVTLNESSFPHLRGKVKLIRVKLIDQRSKPWKIKRGWKVRDWTLILALSLLSYFQ